MIRKILTMGICFLVCFATILFGTESKSKSRLKSEAVNAKEFSYDPTARTSINSPTGPQHVNGRGLGDILLDIDLGAIGMPNLGHANGGLTWDGTYLYVVNQNDSTVYIVDPTVPSIVGSWPTGLNGPWGVGHENDLWITELNAPNGAYEFTYSGTPTGNSFNPLMGGAVWMADASEWWHSGEIWILSVGYSGNKAYKFSVPAGSPLDSIGDPTWTYTSQRGLTYDPMNQKFWVGGWNSDTIWELNEDGTPTGRSFPFNKPASLAYDWQSTIHPLPVLWIATNDVTDHIYMIDPDNGPVTKYWEVLTDIPLLAYGQSEATINQGNYMVFGFEVGAVYPPTTYIYDITSGNWTQGPDNPYGCGAFGVAYGVNGKYYRIGGTDAWPTPINRVDIFDPNGGIWSAGATCSMANMDMIGGVYNDSLIFMFGGGNWGGALSPHTSVYFYDTYEDSWTTCTSFPSPGRGCLAGGIIDSFAIIVAGLDDSYTSHDDYVIGIINPADPSNINWGTAVTIPGGFENRYRVPSGVDNSDNPELWVTCGQGNTTPFLDDIWSYNPNTDTWTNWNKPKNKATANVTPIAVTTTTMGDLGVFVAGGYDGSYLSDHEVFHTEKATGIKEEPDCPITPIAFGITSIAPNPTTDYASIKYSTTRRGKVTLKVYDVTGRLVRTLVDRTNEGAGTKTVFWNGKNNEGESVTAGVYFCRLTTCNKTATKKTVVVK